MHGRQRRPIGVAQPATRGQRGDRIDGIVADGLHRAEGQGPERVEFGRTPGPPAIDETLPVLLVATVASAHDRKGSAAQRRGNRFQVGERTEQERTGELRVDILDPVAPEGEHIAGSVDGIEEVAGIDIGDGHEPGLHLDDHTESPRTAAEHGPEEFGVVEHGGAHHGAVGQDDRQGPDAVHCQAMPPGQPPESTTQGIAHGAHVG